MTGHYFPKHYLPAGYTNNSIGYGEYNVVADTYFPVFRGGAGNLMQGFSFSYQQNIFNGRKECSMDRAANMGYWQSAGEEQCFCSASFCPVSRFHILRSSTAGMFPE